MTQQDKPLMPTFKPCDECITEVGCSQRRKCADIEGRSPPELPPPPGHEKDLLTVGRAQGQHDADGARSSPTSVPSPTPGGCYTARGGDTVHGTLGAGVTICSRTVAGLTHTPFDARTPFACKHCLDILERIS